MAATVGCVCHRANKGSMWSRVWCITAKRLRNTAQGCRVSQLPWVNVHKDANPNGGCVNIFAVQLLEYERTPPDRDVSYLRQTQPLRGWLTVRHVTQGSREARQPWAVWHNRFAVSVV